MSSTVPDVAVEMSKKWQTIMKMRQEKRAKERFKNCQQLRLSKVMGQNDEADRKSVL